MFGREKVEEMVWKFGMDYGKEGLRAGGRKMARTGKYSEIQFLE